MKKLFRSEMGGAYTGPSVPFPGEVSVQISQNFGLVPARLGWGILRAANATLSEVPNKAQAAGVRLDTMVNGLLSQAELGYTAPENTHWELAPYALEVSRPIATAMRRMNPGHEDVYTSTEIIKSRLWRQVILDRGIGDQPPAPGELNRIELCFEAGAALLVGRLDCAVKGYPAAPPVVEA